jgi:hypothetical protein
VHHCIQYTYPAPHPHPIKVINLCTSTTNLQYTNSIKCTPIYHDHPAGDAPFVDLVLYRMNAT